MPLYTLSNLTSNDISVDNITLRKGQSKSVSVLTPQMMAAKDNGKISITPDEDNLLSGSDAYSLTSSPTVYVWTSGNVTFPTMVRFIRASNAGNVQLTDFYGNSITIEFLAGETRAVIAQGIVAAGTTVTRLEGMV